MRSGSIEGVSPTGSGPNLLSTLSQAAAVGGGVAAAAGDQGNATSVGTWKLIKGKVSQTIEDIKSSKHHGGSSHIPHSTSVIPIIVAEPTAITAVGWSNEPDSDTECITINTSVSEEQQLQQQRNSDSDVEVEQLQHDSSSLGSASGVSGDVGGLGVANIERSRLRRGLAHIKSKVKAKQQAATMGKKELSPNPSQPAQRSSFLRRRNNNGAGVSDPKEVSTSAQARDDAASSVAAATAAAGEEPSSSSGSQPKRGIVMARKDVEIESGVEVLEDMMPQVMPDFIGQPVIGLNELNNATLQDVIQNRDALDLPLKKLNPSSVTIAEPLPFIESAFSRPRSMFALRHAGAIGWLSQLVTVPIFIVVSVLLLFFAPMPDFLRGVLATILLIFCMDASTSYIQLLLENNWINHRPERVRFRIPNYLNMPILEIPAVEEHKTIKTYSGWMNEINCYDPNTFSFNLTRAVYIRLDGNVLKLSGTNARIPKRRMWNEPAIDRSKILFTDHRSYDLSDARIELLPLGLAKKRYFNRKYPIQVIINTGVSSSVWREPKPDISPKESKPLNLTPVTAVTPVEDAVSDFAGTVLRADPLRNAVNPDYELQGISMPCGDETRLLLFARCDREKEDWYRRFKAASKGLVHEQDLQVPMARFVDDTDLQAAAAQQAVNLTLGINKPSNQGSRSKVDDDRSVSVYSGASTSTYNEDAGSNTPDTMFDDALDGASRSGTPDGINSFEGLIMNADVCRNNADYVKFMAVYQTRRAKRQEDELWKGIDQSLFLGPSGSVVWANVIMGRCLYSWLHDTTLHEKIQDILQKKLNSIKLPSFMEDVYITNIYLGKSPILFHRMSQPMLDERGTWLDADITYEGLAHITLTTKLNLLRVRSKRATVDSIGLMDGSLRDSGTPETRSHAEDLSQEDSNNAIFDSDAESTGGSSTEEESPPTGAVAEPANTNEFFQNSPGNARRIFKIVDRIATSNLFQYATELPYVQRAMENMSANITLRVELKGMVARGTLNIPPPPSDRVWLCFRGPPRLWLSTKPQVGDKSVDWSIVTNVIESKLCEAVNKFLVYPNMVDLSVPFLAKPSYEDEAGPSGGGAPSGGVPGAATGSSN